MGCEDLWAFQMLDETHQCNAFCIQKTEIEYDYIMMLDAKNRTIQH